MGRTVDQLCATFGSCAVLEGGFPAPDKSECAAQRADIRLEIAEAVWLNAPKGRPGSGIAGTLPAMKVRGRGPYCLLTD